MPLPTDLAAARNVLVAAAEIMDAVVNGPATGPASTVTTEGGEVPTLAKAAAEFNVELEAAQDAASAAAASETATAASALAAEASADAAAVDRAAAEAAATAASGVGGIGAPLDLASPDPRYRAAVVLESGHIIGGDDVRANALAPLQGSTAFFVAQSARGTRVESDATIAARSSLVPYAGPVYDGALWLARPRARSDGKVDVLVNWDRRGVDWSPAIIGSGGLELTAAMAAALYLIVPSFGQSLSQGGTPSPAVFTTSAIDTGIALMPDNISTDHPYSAGLYAFTGLTDLRHAATFGSAGETHIGGMALGFLASMLAAGAKLPGIYWTSGSGGASLLDLDEETAPWMPQSRYGGIWQNLLRGSNFAGRQAENAERFPAWLPLVMIHGEEDSNTAFTGLSASEYSDGLSRLATRFNEDMRRLGNWATAAPDLPFLMTQCQRVGLRMFSSATRVYDRGFTGPMLGQWAAQYRDPRLVLTGPNYHLPQAADGSHLTSNGYFRLGEQIARHLFANVFGKGPRRFNPVAVQRTSATVIDITFQVPSGTLAFDTTRVADAIDGFKGFVAWDNTANAAVTIASVALATVISTDDTVRITLSGAPASTVELWIDYALWPDSSSYTGQSSVNGARGNLRTTTAFASLISGYGESAVNDYDWCPAFRVPVPAWGGSAATHRVDGRL